MTEQAAFNEVPGVNPGVMVQHLFDRIIDGQEMPGQVVVDAGALVLLTVDLLSALKAMRSMADSLADSHRTLARFAHRFAPNATDAQSSVTALVEIDAQRIDVVNNIANHYPDFTLQQLSLLLDAIEHPKGRHQ